MSALRKPPGVAYRLLKYERLVDAEFAIIDKSRNEIITKAASAESGSAVELKLGTPEFEAANSEFLAFLETNSELKPCELDMDDLTTALDAQPGNALAESDLALLEPFFTQSVEEPTS